MPGENIVARLRQRQRARSESHPLSEDDERMNKSISREAQKLHRKKRYVLMEMKRDVERWMPVHRWCMYEYLLVLIIFFPSVQPQANVVDRKLRKSEIRRDLLRRCRHLELVNKVITYLIFIAIDPPTKLRMLESTDQSLKTRSRRVQRFMPGAG